MCFHGRLNGTNEPIFNTDLLAEGVKGKWLMFAV